MEQIIGSIDSIIFSNEENGFCVARIKIPGKQELVVLRGLMPSITPGERAKCEGHWKRHPSHGLQFEVSNFEVFSPQDEEGMYQYLASGLIRGIGPKYAQKIIDIYAEKSFEIIENSPHRLLDIPGFGEKKLAMVVDSWQEHKTLRSLMVFLAKHSIRLSLAKKIYRVHGEESIEKIKENPYLLAKTVFGIGFKSADELAAKLGFEKEHPLRLKSGIEHTLWELSQEGHTCLPRDFLLQTGANLLEVQEKDLEPPINELEEEGSIVISELQERPFVWIKPLYSCEVGIARELLRILDSPCSLRRIQTDIAIQWAEQLLHLQFAEEQKKAIADATSNKIQIITGGPGTGKSTITKAIIRILEKISPNVVLAAPTGRAAKRMTEITYRKASTIHSLLEFDFNTGKFKKDRKNPIKADLLIVDEVSMVDTQLMYHLLKAIGDTCRVVFIGDIDQLPSVGPGNVLKDLIFSEALPVTRLKEIFRQAKGSQIIVNSHRINEGEFPYLTSKRKSDFTFIEESEPERIQQLILTQIEGELSQKMGFDPIDQIQVLTPMKRGPIGTESLNHILQQKLNPTGKEVTHFGKTFRLGDKVMQIRNDYNKNVYNGDVGRIAAIDLEAQQLLIDMDGREVEYDFHELDEVMLAYAVSIHKYQGSECPCIIMPVHTSHFKLLFRNLLYTGLTRGKRHVVMIGSKKALAIGVKKQDVLQRYTGLCEIMKNNFSSEIDLEERLISTPQTPS